MTPTIRKTLLALMTEPALSDHEQTELFRLAMRPNDPEWISESEAAKLLGMSDRQLAAWAAGKLDERYGPCPLTIYTPRAVGGTRRYDLREVRTIRDQDTHQPRETTPCQK